MNEMSMKSSLVLILSAASLCLACAPGGGGTDDDMDEEDVAEARSALAVNNARSMNGTAYNGTYLNGIKFNGIKFNGIKFNGVTQTGTSLEGTREDNGLTVTGTGFEGSDLDGTLGDSTAVTVRIASISTTDVPGMLTYEITQNDENICGTAGAKAFLLPGTWNYTTASYSDSTTESTVACRGAGIAKCTEFGYKNWQNWAENNGTDTQQVPLRYFQEACVRLLRADYCGNGVSHTENGTPIDLYDAASIQVISPTNTMPLEAEWSASGATCIKHVRWTATEADPTVDVEDYITANCPSRWAGPESTTCGASTSEYFTANGFKSTPTTYVAPWATRPLLRNMSDQHTH
jgi:uncharacterized protein YjbI with pentapeptide repeats